MASTLNEKQYWKKKMHASPAYQFITRGQRLTRIKIIFLMASIFDNFLPA